LSKTLPPIAGRLSIYSIKKALSTRPENFAQKEPARFPSREGTGSKESLPGCQQKNEKNL
jgi:hypothetical protein